MPEITAQKVYMIHCDDCGMLYINDEAANPNEYDLTRDITPMNSPLIQRVS